MQIVVSSFLLRINYSHAVSTSCADNLTDDEESIFVNARMLRDFAYERMLKHLLKGAKSKLKECK